MRFIKLAVMVVVVTIVMVISWVVGNMVGNWLTGSAPPPPQDPSATAQWFFIVTVFNALLVTVLIHSTRKSAGFARWSSLILYVFAVQFLLPQMETFFFASEIGIGADQAAAILISGGVVCVLTMPVAIFLHSKLFVSGVTVSPSYTERWQFRKMMPWAVLPILIGYPLIYLTFGYYVAWQSESLRLFYTDSPVLASYGHQVVEAFGNGIYLFQILRGIIWLLASIPVVLMLRGNTTSQFLIVGILSALLPTSLLFIPNPYMPADVAMIHFVETSTSNFVWGLLMVWAIRRGESAREVVGAAQ
jgi:hypothetical protein